MLSGLSARALGASVALLMAGAAASSAATVTVDLGPAGSGQPFGTGQPSLGLTPLVQVVEGNAPGTLGQVVWFAGNFDTGGFMMADGRELAIAGNVALFQRFGTTYGGNGTTTFRLPDLRGRTVVGAGGSYSLGTQVGSDMVTLTEGNLPAHTHSTATGPSTATGGGQPFGNVMPGLALDLEIDSAGFVTFDAAADVDPVLRPTDGRALSMATEDDLLPEIGPTFGGDGVSTYALPDTRDRLVVGAGTAPGLTTRTLGQTRGTATETLTEAQMPAHTHLDPDGNVPSGAAGGGAPVNNLQPELTLNYLIAVQGIFPGGGSTSGVFGTPDQPYLGQVVAYAGIAPGNLRDYLVAQGQLLPINQNQALFSILGTTFGGDGVRTFALPDLRGRTPVGAAFGNAFPSLGEAGGSERVFLSAANLPVHGHQVLRDDGGDPSVVPLPASALLLAGGLGLLALRRRARAA